MITIDEITTIIDGNRLHEVSQENLDNWAGAYKGFVNSAYGLNGQVVCGDENSYKIFRALRKEQMRRLTI